MPKLKNPPSRSPRDAVLTAMMDECLQWRRLWCDQPEDRLYHGKDHTWWKRVNVPEGAFKEYDAPPYRPFRADPPPEIMLIVQAARTVSKKTKELARALSYFPEVGYYDVHGEDPAGRKQLQRQRAGRGGRAANRRGRGHK